MASGLTDAMHASLVERYTVKQRRVTDEAAGCLALIHPHLRYMGKLVAELDTTSATFAWTSTSVQLLGTESSSNVVQPDASVQAIIETYKPAVDAVGDKTVGKLNAPFSWACSFVVSRSDVGRSAIRKALTSWQAGGARWSCLMTSKNLCCQAMPYDHVRAYI